MTLEPIPWVIPEPAVSDFAKALGKPVSAGASVMLFRASHDGKTLYCAQCGGGRNARAAPDPSNYAHKADLDSDVGRDLAEQFWFTAHGNAAAHALLDWYRHEGQTGQVIMKEVVSGPTPMLEKLRDTFRIAPDRSMVMFVGDFAKSLDGEIAKLILRSLRNGEI